MNERWKYCGRISKNPCPKRSPEGYCEANELFETDDGHCPDMVPIANEETGFIVRYIHHIRANGTRAFSASSRNHSSYPDNLYCTQFWEICPHQMPGGKCKYHSNMPGTDPCPHELTLSPDCELIVRLLHFVHRDKENQK